LGSKFTKDHFKRIQIDLQFLNIAIPPNAYLNFDPCDNKNIPKQIQITTQDLSLNDINIVLDSFG
jgi:hypothetical protein